MERLAPQRPAGIGKKALRIWGALFLAAEVVSCAVLQNRVLGLGSVSSQQLLEAMENSYDVMAVATTALILKVLGACAVPIFSFFLAEGAKHTSNFEAYLLRIAALAVVSEIPYNFAYSGKLLDFSGRNPVFGLVFALAVLYFFRRYSTKKLTDIFIRIAVTAAAVLWCVMLSVEKGAAVVLLTAVIWLLWDKPSLRNIAGASVLMVCSLFSLFLMASPMAFLAIHSYNGEIKDENKWLKYMFYPGLLIAASFVGAIL